MKELTDFIELYRKEASVELCDQIINTTKASELWEPGLSEIGGSPEARERVISPARKCQTLALAKWPHLDAEVFKVVSRAIGRYQSTHAYTDVYMDEGYTVLRYEVGDYVNEHADHYLDAPRVLSCSIILNEDYEGGEFAFFGGEKIYRPQRGDVLMFPSSFAFPHAVLPITKGTRYSIITWMK